MDLMFGWLKQVLRSGGYLLGTVDHVNDDGDGDREWNYEVIAAEVMRVHADKMKWRPRERV